MASRDDPASDYIRIEPTTDAIDHTRAPHILRSFAKYEPDPRFIHRFPWINPEPYTYEWVVTATPTGAGTSLQYLVGADERLDVEKLRAPLRTLLPNSYELTTTTTGPLAAFPDTEWAHAVEAIGDPERYADWITRLRPFDAPSESADHTPLSAVLDVLRDAQTPCLLQVCCRPTDKISDKRSDREIQLRDGSLTPAHDFTTAMLPISQDTDATSDPPDRCQSRLDHLNKKKSRAFTVSLRILVGDGPQAELTAEQLANALPVLSGEYYGIRGETTTETERVVQAVRDRRVAAAKYRYDELCFPDRWGISRGIVADTHELGSFCLIDGNDLTEPTRRAFGAQPTAPHMSTPPAPEVLDRYDHGFPLGRLRNSEGHTEATRVSIPPDRQPQHLLLAGSSGSGKTVSLVNGILENHRATAGPDILIEPKGDDMVSTLLGSYYADHGDLDDVYYFDCARTLPAVSILDIRPELEAGIPRPTAVMNAIDHYEALLRALMPDDEYDAALRSPDVIRYLLRAQFDPVHGSDVVTHADLKQAAMRLQTEQTCPPVSDDALERDLSTVVNTDARTFEKIMGGVMTRLDTVSQDPRFRALFNSTDARFDLADLLDEDALIVLDIGDLDTAPQQAITQVLLANLWSALQRRAQHTPEQAAATDRPLVNLYLEEAATFAELDLLGELLDQSRSFGIGLVLATQFPGQFADGASGLYDRILNNVGTMAVGNVSADDRLVQALATTEQSPSDVATTLNSRGTGTWLVSLPPVYGTTEPDLFQVTSLPLPAGHPEYGGADAPDRAAVATAIDARAATVADQAGIDLTAVSTDTRVDTEQPDPLGPITIDSPLPYTERLPPTVAYDADRRALECTECGALHDPTRRGMLAAIRCHDALSSVEPANIPICDLNLSLSQVECDETPYTQRQLLFLQAVYNAQSLVYDAPMYDIVYDSMLRLREYLGIDGAAVDELIEAGLLKRDGQRPHLLYTVTGDGRALLNESHREGVDYGHGVGDLDETSEHRMLVDALARYLEQEYVADPESPVTEVCRYYEPSSQATPTVPATAAMGATADPQAAAERADRRRFDVVGLDGDGQVRVAGEAERCNNDVAEAAVADYDKMADYDPDEAIWVVPSRSAATSIVEALHDPPTGEPRVGKTYSSGTPPEQYRIDTSGLSEMLTFTTVRDRLPVPIPGDQPES